MRKDFGVKTWAYPMPVFIVAAYDKEGVPCCMNAAWGGTYDPVHHTYLQLGPKVGNAFADGKKLK